METKQPEQVGRGDGYEHRDASIPSLLKLGLGLAILIAVTLVAMKWTFRIIDRYEPLGPAAVPFASSSQPTPGPLLQAAPHMDLKEYCVAQQSNVSTYAWVDKQQGTVRIPVDRAMDLILQQGLPVRASGGAPSGAAPAMDMPGSTVGGQNTQAASYLQGPCGYLADQDVAVPKD